MSKKSTSYLVAGLLGLLLLLVATWTTAARAAAPPKQGVNTLAQPTQDTSVRAAATITGCDLIWQQVASRNTDGLASVLLDIDAIAGNDIWAVGNNQEGTHASFVIQHWDGTQWDFSGQDVAKGIPGELQAVAAVASDDVWAAGTLYYSGYTTGSNHVALLLHWDGTEWNTVQAPMPAGSSSSGILDIVAAAPDNIWAVGYVHVNRVPQALTLHWNGVEWSAVQVAGGQNTILNAVSVRAQDDVWAVGINYPGAQAITMHWDGVKWATVPVPGIGLSGSTLEGVIALAPDDAWAVGSLRTYSGSGGGSKAWMLHWDGQAWHDASPTQEVVYAGLSDVVALSPNNIWAAGSNSAYAPEGPVLMHWDGTGWTRVREPDFSDKNEGIWSLAVVSAREIWGAGWLTTVSTGQNETFVVRGMPGAACNLPTQTPLPAATPSSTPEAGPCAPTLQQLDSPNNLPLENIFYDVEPLAHDDVWAAGHAFSRYGMGGDRSRIERFDGSQWSVLYESPPTYSRTVIHAIEVLAPDDVWAAGVRVGDRGYPLMHWDGQTWSEHSYASWIAGDVLHALYAVSTNDIWAAGGRANKALTLHWDGTAWTEVPVPEIPGTLHSYNPLFGLSGTATDDVWAVGDMSREDVNNTWYTDVLIAHWDGDAWSVTGLPPVEGEDPKYARLTSVSALSRDDVWVAGLYDTHFGAVKPIIMHWDGLAWTSQAVPKPPYADMSLLSDVAALAEDDVWAAGTSNGGKSIQDEQAYAVHWDGAEWELLPTHRPQNEQSNLNSIAAVRGVPGEIWMVGDRDTATAPETLALRFSRSCEAATATPTASPSPSPTHTSTATRTPTITATAMSTSTATPEDTTTATASANGTTGTPTAPTNTATPVVTPLVEQSTGTPTTPTATATTAATHAATATTTVCGLQFADLPPGSTFQPFALCLACKGILSGYDCGGQGEPCNEQNSPYFRPGKLVTRGQVAKIVANALGLAGEPGEQLFEDVPPGSTFYSYVNRLASLGVMGGYPCGTAGEPCHEGNLPYFRPDANATRGQIAKIVSNAAGYAEEHTGQTFEDVPGTHTFYLPVERLASRAAMSGYDCNGPGEPCGPANLPYFRPNDSAIRGHVAKIVANTFFEECAAP